jgi:hypothetical protein
MAGLPKKYAKMGFKKGWKEYKKIKSSSNKKAVTSALFNRKTKAVPTASRRVKKMAKRRRTYAKRRTSRRSGGMGQLTKLALAGAGYGLIREPLNQLVAKVPFVGSFGDEVALGMASLLLASKGTGIVKKIGQAGVLIEAHNLARGGMGGIMGMFGSSSSSSVVQSNGFR